MQWQSINNQELDISDKLEKKLESEDGQGSLDPKATPRRSERIKDINRRFRGPIYYEKVKRKAPKPEESLIFMEDTIDESQPMKQKGKPAPKAGHKGIGAKPLTAADIEADLGVYVSDNEDMMASASSMINDEIALESMEVPSGGEEKEENLFQADGQLLDQAELEGPSNGEADVKDEPENNFLVNPLNELLINFLLQLKQTEQGVEGLPELATSNKSDN